MAPITGIVEKKATETAWAFIKGLFTRDRDQKKRIETLEAENAELRGGKQAYAQLLSDLECLDGMYWNRDGSEGGPYCIYCVHATKECVPLIDNGGGAYYCRIHDHLFETTERRERRHEARHYPVMSVRRPSRFRSPRYMR
jgi:hypothetical protein